MKSVKVPLSYCPSCGYTLDGASDVIGLNSPSVGDYSICVNCYSINRFGLGLILNKAEESSIPKSVKAKIAIYIQNLKKQKRDR